MRKTILIHFIILPAISFVSLSQTYMVADPPDSGDTLIEKTEIAKDTSNNNVKEKDNSQKSI